MHISFGRTERTLNRVSSFLSHLHFQVCFVYVFTKLESGIWSWLALTQRSQTIASGFESCWQTRLASTMFANLNVNVFVADTCFLKPYKPYFFLLSFPAQLTYLCSGSSPFTYLCLQSHSLDADGCRCWYVVSSGKDVTDSFGIQTGKKLIRLMQTPVKLGAWGEVVGRKLSQWEDEGWTKSEGLQPLVQFTLPGSRGYEGDRRWSQLVWQKKKKILCWAKRKEES